MSNNNINSENISDKELEAAAGGARPQIEIQGAKEGEVQIINPDTPSDVTVTGINKGIQSFG